MPMKWCEGLGFFFCSQKCNEQKKKYNNPNPTIVSRVCRAGRRPRPCGGRRGGRRRRKDARCSAPPGRCGREAGRRPGGREAGPRLRAREDGRRESILRPCPALSRGPSRWRTGRRAAHRSRPEALLLVELDGAVDQLVILLTQPEDKISSLEAPLFLVPADLQKTPWM